jgi:hypothetical protein
MVRVLKPTTCQEHHMPVASDHTQLATVPQLPPLVGDSWATEVVPRLPVDLAAQAAHLGAFQRQRGLTCPTDLLRALLAYVLCAASFRLLGAWAVLLGLADLSEAAWRKRLRRANAWVLWLLTELCAAPPTAPAPDPGRSAGTARRILLVDATMVGTPGGNGDEWRLHTAYDFTAGRLSEVVLGDRSSGEHLDHYVLRAGDIVVADSGYGYRRNLVTARKAQADVVLRITHRGFPLETAAGEALDLVAWVQRGRGPYRQTAAVCRINRQAFRVRVLALRLPPEAAQQARQRALRRASKHSRAVRAVTLAMAEWVLLVTTLDVGTWPAEDVRRLYRARWQVELLFKRWKSLLQVNDLRVQQRVAVEAVLRLKLLAWLLQAEVAAEVRGLLTQVQAPPTWRLQHSGAVSTWRLTALSIATLRQHVQGSWTYARLLQCLPRLRRFLGESWRQRLHQETTFRLSFLEPQLPTRPLLLAAA